MDSRFILLEGKQTKHVRISQQAVPHANEIGIDRTAAAPDTRFGRATSAATANSTATTPPTNCMTSR